MADRRRVRKWREIITVVVARQNTIGDVLSETATVEARVTGLSSLLRVSVQLAFFATNKKFLSFAALDPGCHWSLYGLTMDEAGEVTRLSETPINDGGEVPVPEGWEGSSGLEGILVSATLVANATGGSADNGEWRLSAVLEPVDPSMSQHMFDELCAKVDITPPGSIPTLGLA